VQLASTLNLPKGQEELAVAGAAKGEAIELVKAKTSDLLVPANTEIIVEGEVVPGEIALEGPFGEFAGYMGPIAPKPVGRITAITTRENPIYYGVTSQMPPSESTVIQSLTNAGVILKTLRHDLSELTVSDVYIDLTFGGLLAHAVIAMEPRYAGHAKKVGRMVADCAPVKRVTVVDPDVDIRDSSHIEWAMNARYHPARDTVIIDDVYMPMGMDPAVRVADGRTDQGSKVVIDATATIDSGDFSLPGQEVMARALESWREAGLPEFDVPKRARLRLDKS
jgi:UbiD family decarboxylase